MKEEKTCVLKPTAAATTGAANESRSASFVLIAGGEIGRMYKLESETTIIGRSSEATVQLQDTGVSRKHARVIHHSDGTVEIIDLQSTNGTFCNGERVDRRMLQDGDKIQIGTTTIFRFSYQDGLEEEFQRRQYESATRDVLTNCYNRKYLIERLPSEFAFARRHAQILSIAMIDLDNFKAINDTYGHMVGDYVLKSVARVIQQTIRADDVLARYGGEEFAILMRNTPPEEAARGAERVRNAVATSSFAFEGRGFSVTVSIGISACTKTGPDDPQQVMQAADLLLYKAKKNGKNRVESETPQE